MGSQGWHDQAACGAGHDRFNQQLPNIDHGWHGIAHGIVQLSTKCVVRAKDPGEQTPASTRLLHSFAAWPVLGPPQCIDLLPMRLSSGCAALNAAGAPPHCMRQRRSVDQNAL